MARYGFNVSLRNTVEEIRQAGEKFLGTGLYEAIEATYYDNMADTDVSAYNAVLQELVEKYIRGSPCIWRISTSAKKMLLREAIFENVKNCFAYTKMLGGSHVVIHCGIKNTGSHVPLTYFYGSSAMRKRRFKGKWTSLSL